MLHGRRGRLTRPGAADRHESREADGHRHRAERLKPFGDEPPKYLTGELHAAPLDEGGVEGVLLEGLLLAYRFALPLVRHGIVGVSPHLLVQLLARLSEPFPELRELDAAELGHGPDALLLKNSLRLWPDPWDDPDPQPVQESLHLVGPHHGQTVRLPEVRRDLRHELVRSDADRAGQSLALEDRSLQRPRVRFAPLHPAEG